MQTLSTTSYSKGSGASLNPITSITNHADGGVTGFKFNEGSNLSNQYWGANANGYEDYNFFYEVWPTRENDNVTLLG